VDHIPIAAIDVDDGSVEIVKETKEEEEVEAEDDNEDDEKEFLVEEDLQDEFAQFDVNNQLYTLEMILSFHVWYKCGSPYLVGGEEDVLVVDHAICSMLASIKKIFHGIRITNGSYRSFMSSFTFHGTCTCLGLPKTGMPVLVITI